MAFSLFPQGLYLRELHNNSGRDVLLTNAFHVELIANGNAVPFTERATPVQLQLISDAGTVDICFAQPNLIRVRAHGVGVRLTSSTQGNYAVELDTESGRFTAGANTDLAHLRGVYGSCTTGLEQIRRRL